IRAASRTWGSDAATIEAIDQMGFVSATWRSRYQRIAEAMKTLTANRTPSRSRLTKLGHLIRVRASAREAGHAGALRGDREETPLLVPELDVAEDIAGASVACVGVLENPRARRGREELHRDLQADQHPLLSRSERLTDGRHHVVGGQEVGHRIEAAVGQQRRL